MSYSEFDPATEMEAWRARCLKAEQEAAALRQERDSVQRELERWRHGVTVEGDFVCPDSAALADRDQQLAAAKDQIAALRELLSEAWGAIAGYPFRNDITARIDAVLGIDRNATPITHEEIKRALEIGAAERIEAEARVARPGRYASRSIGPNRAAIEAEVVAQVAAWLEDAAGMATDCADCWCGAAEDLRSGAWKR